MRTVYFITRTWSINTAKDSGCGTIRNAEVREFSKKHHVIVVAPNVPMDSADILSEQFYYSKRTLLLERAGLLEDYLDGWVKKIIPTLLKKVKKEDVVIATTGGELGCIKVGYILKQQVGCKFIINFHDPVLYTVVGEQLIGRMPHVSREKIFCTYLKAADYVVTSSESYRTELIGKYSNLASASKTIYFGYWDEIQVDHHNVMHINDRTTVVYGGAMGPAQRVDLIVKALAKLQDVNFVIVGEASRQLLALAECNSNITILPLMTHDKYLDYLTKQADIGLVSLYGNQWGVCVPSKIFEYINAEIPILGFLPHGDAQNIINKNEYGYAAADVDEVVSGLKTLQNESVRAKVTQNIIRDKKKYNISNLFEGFNDLIEQI